MTVSFEHCNKIIANAELSIVACYEEQVTIFGVDYEVLDYRHEVEIKIRPSGKKCVVEKIICIVLAISDKE